MLHELPVIRLSLNNKVYKLRVASDVSSKRSGLSGIQHLGEDEGFLFAYNDDKPRTFQFRDTCLPLQVYFMGSNGKVLQRSFSSPYQQESISRPYPCRWVIEILDV